MRDQYVLMAGPLPDSPCQNTTPSRPARRPARGAGSQPGTKATGCHCCIKYRKMYVENRAAQTCDRVIWSTARRGVARREQWIAASRYASPRPLCSTNVSRAARPAVSASPPPPRQPPQPTSDIRHPRLHAEISRPESSLCGLKATLLIISQPCRVKPRVASDVRRPTDGLAWEEGLTKRPGRPGGQPPAHPATPRHATPRPRALW